MKREEAKFCEECKKCEQIVRQFGESYYIQCSKKLFTFDEPVVYCKYKKNKKGEKQC